jgi:hypothetical protein
MERVYLNIYVIPIHICLRLPNFWKPSYAPLMFSNFGHFWSIAPTSTLLIPDNFDYARSQSWEKNFG